MLFETVDLTLRMKCDMLLYNYILLGSEVFKTLVMRNIHTLCMYATNRREYEMEIL